MPDVDLPNPNAVQPSLFPFYRNPSTYGMNVTREYCACVTVETAGYSKSMTAREYKGYFSFYRESKVTT